MGSSLGLCYLRYLCKKASFIYFLTTDFTDGTDEE